MLKTGSSGLKRSPCENLGPTRVKRYSAPLISVPSPENVVRATLATSIATTIGESRVEVAPWLFLHPESAHQPLLLRALEANCSRPMLDLAHRRADKTTEWHDALTSWYEHRHQGGRAGCPDGCCPTSAAENVAQRATRQPAEKECGPLAHDALPTLEQCARQVNERAATMDAARQLLELLSGEAATPAQSA